MATAALKGTLVRQSYACLAVKVASKDAISSYSMKGLVWVERVRTARVDDVTACG